jgi:hypothetical protein
VRTRKGRGRAARDQGRTGDLPDVLARLAESRIAFVVLTIAGGAGMPLYLADLLLIPEDGSDQSIAGAFIESRQSRSR